MYCKYCGNPNVKVGKFCSRCGTRIEPLPIGWTPIVPRPPVKIEKKEQDPQTLLVQQEARKEVGKALSGILKVGWFILLWPVLIVAVLLSMDLTSGKPGHKRIQTRGSAGIGSCDGDCDNCPPHYGYRYGRWYYGHGHRHGCQRGGNGGASGRCAKD